MAIGSHYPELHPAHEPSLDVIGHDLYPAGGRADHIDGTVRRRLSLLQFARWVLGIVTGGVHATRAGCLTRLASPQPTPKDTAIPSFTILRRGGNRQSSCLSRWRSLRGSCFADQRESRAAPRTRRPGTAAGAPVRCCSCLSRGPRAPDDRERVGPHVEVGAGVVAGGAVDAETAWRCILVRMWRLVTTGVRFERCLYSRRCDLVAPRWLYCVKAVCSRA